MPRWISGAVLAAALTLSVGATTSSAAAAQGEVQKATTSGATDVRARRHYRHDRYRDAYRPYYPYYDGRPTYYAPAPFFPIPPLFGYGWEWW